MNCCRAMFISKCPTELEQESQCEMIFDKNDIIKTRVSHPKVILSCEGSSFALKPLPSSSASSLSSSFDEHASEALRTSLQRAIQLARQDSFKLCKRQIKI